MGSRRRGARQRRWLATAVVVALAAVVSLTIWVGFLSGRSLSEADSWSSAASAAIAYVAALAALVVWMVQCSRRAIGENGFSPALAILRAEVKTVWADQAARSLFLPKPLRLRWRGEPVIQVRGQRRHVDGELLAGTDDGRPAAVALVELFADPGVRQLVVLGEAGAGKALWRRQSLFHDWVRGCISLGSARSV